MMYLRTVCVTSVLDHCMVIQKHTHAAYRDFLSCKKMKIAIFLIFAQNIDCGYTLEPPRPVNILEQIYIKKIGIPPHIPVLLYKKGFEGVNISRTCFPDA